MRTILAILLGIAAAAFVAASEPVPRAADSAAPAPFDHFPEGSTVRSALLVTDVVQGEAYDRAGLSRCDLLMGFETVYGAGGDVLDYPGFGIFLRVLERAARGKGVYLNVLKRRVVTSPDGAVGDSYEVWQPRPRVLLNSTPGDRLIIAMILVVAVTEVATGGEAEALGLRTGDIVLAVNDENLLREANTTIAAREAIERTVRDNAGRMSLQVARCEPWGDGYLLRRRRPATYEVDAPAGTP